MMTKILVFKMKLLNKKTLEIERAQIGFVTWNDDGALSVETSGGESEIAINKAVEMANTRGVFRISSNDTDGKRIQYQERVPSTNPDYPKLLAEQLFSPEDKLDGYNLIALHEEQFGKNVDKWEPLGHNRYRSRYTKEHYLREMKRLRESNEYLFISMKVRDLYENGHVGQTIDFFLDKCSQIIAQNKPRSRHEKPSLFSFNSSVNQRRRDMIQKYQKADRLLRSLETFKALYFKGLGDIWNLDRKLVRLFSEFEERHDSNKLKKFSGQIEMQKDAINSHLRKRFSDLCHSTSADDLNVKAYITGVLGYKSVDDFLDKSFSGGNS